MSVLDLYSYVLIGLGVLFFSTGTIGLLRFPDALSRLHALAKADNLALGLVVLGLLPQAAWPLGAMKLLAVWLFALLASTTVGQLVGEAIRHGDPFR